MSQLSSTALHHQAQSAFEQGYYLQAIQLYEQLVEQQPDQIESVWYLGLSHLLSGDETTAQLTWMMALSEAEAEQTEAYTDSLVRVLQTAAKRQEGSENWPMAWAIRQHIREIAPAELHNLLKLLRISMTLEQLNRDGLVELGLTELLQSQRFPELDEMLLLQAVEEILECGFSDPPVQEFVEAALTQIDNSQLIVERFSAKAQELKDRTDRRYLPLACYLAEVCCRYSPDQLETLKLLSALYEELGRYDEAVEAAETALTLCTTVAEQMTMIGLLCVRLLKTGLAWQRVRELYEQQLRLLPSLLAEYRAKDTALVQTLEPSLLTLCGFYGFYLEDQPRRHRAFQNQLAALVQQDLQLQAEPIFKSPYLSAPTGLAAPSSRLASHRKLKIGYLSRYMRQHSVGWLARWLMQYHDYEQFDIYTYHLHVTQIGEFTRRWFIDPVTHSAQFKDGSWAGIAKHICEQDQIDILVDLDSLTYSETCSVLSLKPAPIQVSWLGFDSTGLPAVDYVLADPYVLPEQASDYYSEKIWCMPSTYLAVEGFEIDVPSLRRDQMGVPADAVVYFSSQDARKRHPEMIRTQLQILKAVPNSYLFVKGLGDEASVKELFYQLADEVGVGRDQLRFLPRDRNEATHRANLSIADVVLDTYPYNGASTTLETLWVGVPLVTQVGQQWAARNSYTMLMNVGITEGIAQSESEYIEWGIRLGQDATLRQDIRTRLLKSRQTSPLWNTRQFARDLEAAYRQMWQIYTAG
ncbi:MAG: O-linked N-acetylglucosamine transferase, SPINDLY family protein [Elainella sp.]